MKKLMDRFNNWCLKYQGILVFLGAIGALIVPFLVPGVDAHSLSNGMSNLGRVLTYHFPVYTYQLIIVVALAWFIYYRFRRRYRVQGVSQKIMVGVWKNNWGPPNSGEEIFKVTPDLKYYIGDEHMFDIKDFNYDPQTNYIEFKKVGARNGDNRNVYNKVRIVDNDTLEGIEQDYPIKYKRLAV